MKQGPLLLSLLAIGGLCGCSLLSGIKVNGKPIGGAASGSGTGQTRDAVSGPGTPAKDAKGKMSEASGALGPYPEIFVEEGLAGPEHCVTELAPSTDIPVADQVRSIGCAKLVFACTDRSGQKHYCTDPYNDGKHVYPWMDAHWVHKSMSDAGDPLKMGLLIAAYARDKKYFFQNAYKPRHGTRDFRPTPTNPAVVTGQLLDYVARLEPKAFRGALANVDVAGPVRSAVAQLISKGVTLLKEEAQSIDPGIREVTLEVPKQVRVRRAEHQKRFHKQFARAEKLRNKIQASIRAAKPDFSLFAQAASLRDDYLEACRKQLALVECIGGPLANPLTAAMIELAQAVGNHNLAYAENFLLYRAEREVTLAEAVSAEQERRVSALMEQYNGTAEQAARQAGGGHFKNNPEDLVWSMPRKPTDYGYNLSVGNGWNHFRARVKAIKRQGKNAKIEFFPDDGERIVAYNCSKKSVFVGFDNNGRAEYDKVCNHKRVAAKYPVKPITIAASETVGIRKGDDATFVRTEKGSTHFVYAMDKDGNNAAVRGLRLRNGDLPNFWKR